MEKGGQGSKLAYCKSAEKGAILQATSFYSPFCLLILVINQHDITSWKITTFPSGAGVDKFLLYARLFLHSFQTHLYNNGSLYETWDSLKTREHIREAGSVY